MKRKTNEFAVYKGEEFLFIGTAKECAARMSISESSFRFLLTPSYKKRIEKRKAKNYLVVVKLDEDEQEDEPED